MLSTPSSMTRAELAIIAVFSGMLGACARYLHRLRPGVSNVEGVIGGAHLLRVVADRSAPHRSVAVDDGAVPAVDRPTGAEERT